MKSMHQPFVRKLFILSSLVGACSVASSCAPSAADQGRLVAREATSLSAAIESASQRFGVPRDILLAVSYAEGQWVDRGIPEVHALDLHEEQSAHAGPEVGPLHLRSGVGYDSLGRAMALLHADRATLMNSMGLQVAGAAAVLAELGEQTGARFDDPESWARAVAKYSGLHETTTQQSYVENVWDSLRNGRSGTTFSGETLSIQSRLGRPAAELLGIDQIAQNSPDYGPALWAAAAAGNFSAGRAGMTVDKIVVHTMQGSYSGSISWFQNPASGVSAHYCVRSSDGQVTQQVRESDTAYHGGNRFYNQTSIGIEHEGFVADPGRWYTMAMYVGSARLARAIVDRYRIPIDRAHIIGHYQIPVSGSGAPCATNAMNCGGAGQHNDPGNGGTGWNWDLYLQLIRNNGMVGPMTPDYDAALVGAVYNMEGTSGDRPVVRVTYRNTGTRSWDTTNTRLGTTGPRDHNGRFYDMTNWLNPTRPTAVDAVTAAGAMGVFSFVISLPDVAMDTTITESYGLLQENVAWFGPPDNAVTLRVLVHPRGAQPTDSGVAVNDTPDPVQPEDVPDPPVEMDSGVGPVEDSGVATVDVPSRGNSADVRNSRDGGDGGGDASTCGCRVPGSQQSKSQPLVYLAAGALAALSSRRRRRA